MFSYMEASQDDPLAGHLIPASTVDPALSEKWPASHTTPMRGNGDKGATAKFRGLGSRRQLWRGVDSAILPPIPEFILEV